MHHLWAWLTRRRDLVWVRLTFEDGTAKALGPMDRLSADAFLMHRIARSGAWNGRRVTSARIVGR